MKNFIKSISGIFASDKSKNNCLHPGIFIVTKLMEKTECEELVKRIEAGGFKKARQYDEGRHNKETFIVDEMLTENIVGRLKGFRFSCGNELFRVVQITRPLEFYKYDASDFIKVHSDAPREVVPGKKSSHTLVIYLNDDMEGGETFFPKFDVKITPGSGNGLLFKQEHDHAGSLVNKGSKYILRCACLTEKV